MSRELPQTRSSKSSISGSLPTSESLQNDPSRSIARGASEPPPTFETPDIRASSSSKTNISSPPGYPSVDFTARRPLPADGEEKVDISSNRPHDPPHDRPAYPFGTAFLSDDDDSHRRGDPTDANLSRRRYDGDYKPQDEPPRRPDPSWDLWADHDRGAAGLQATRGFTSSTNAAEIILVATAQIPVDRLAKQLRKIGGCKEELGSIYRIASVFERYRSDICVPLCEATKLTGSKCRAKIDQAASLLFGSEDVHCAVIYAIMVTIWSINPKSAKADIISAVLTDYIHTSDAMVDTFIKGTSVGRTLNVELSSSTPALDLPGMIRLDPYRNSDFTKAWCDVWTGCVNVICGIIHDAEVDQSLKDWEITSAAHPLVAARGELVQSVLARHLTAIAHISSMAQRFDAPQRKPDIHRQGANFLKAFVYRTTMLATFEKIWREEKSYSGLTLANVVEALEIAQARSSTTIPALQAVNAMRAGRSQPPHSRSGGPPAPTGKQQSNQQGNPRYKKQGTNYPPLIVGFAAHVTQKDGKRYILNPGPDADQAEIDRRMAAEECLNCGSIFKGCRTKVCPFTRRDKKDWLPHHEPMRVTKDMLMAVKSKLIAAPAVRDDGYAPLDQEDPDPDEATFTPLLALDFPEEPPLPPGLSCGAVLSGQQGPFTQHPCIRQEEALSLDEALQLDEASFLAWASPPPVSAAELSPTTIFPIFVRLLSGRTLALDVSGADTIASIKAAIQDREGAPG